MTRTCNHIFFISGKNFTLLNDYVPYFLDPIIIHWYVTRENIPNGTPFLPFMQHYLAYTINSNHSQLLCKGVFSYLPLTIRLQITDVMVKIMEPGCYDHSTLVLLLC
jgi:hypothetical protein